MPHTGPISLLNTDTKILAKVLARRLENILPIIISKDQTGFIKHRHPYFNIHWLLDIIYTSPGVVPECVVSLDAEKAFDRVEFNFLFAVLDRFGFGPNFSSWIQLLYSCPTASIRTNSQQSKPFNLHRGTRQECPLSPLLFDLAIEPLAAALRGCRDINGIWRNSTEHKVSLYTDDLLLFISNPGTLLTAALSLLSQFGKLSDYKLNLSKSELFPINNKAHALDYSNLPFRVEKHKLSYLGVLITKKHTDLFKENLITLLNQIKQTLTQWSPLSMSLVGQLNSIKMNILPKFLYLFQSLPVFIPASFFNQLDSVLSAFIWQGKRPRLSKVHLQKTKSTGGFALPNFRLYYWAANLRCMAFWSFYADRPGAPDWVAMELHLPRTSLPALLDTL